jgi:hypothetical protein
VLQEGLEGHDVERSVGHDDEVLPGEARLDGREERGQAQLDAGARRFRRLRLPFWMWLFTSGSE